MNFKLGKKYIVKVTEKGIIPIEEFSEERYFNKDLDSIDFLTDEEKVIIIKNVLNELKTEIENLPTGVELTDGTIREFTFKNYKKGLLKIIDDKVKEYME